MRTLMYFFRKNEFSTLLGLVFVSLGTLAITMSNLFENEVNKFFWVPFLLFGVTGLIAPLSFFFLNKIYTRKRVLDVMIFYGDGGGFLFQLMPFVLGCVVTYSLKQLFSNLLIALSSGILAIFILTFFLFLFYVFLSKKYP